MAMMAITTRSSIRVKALRFCCLRCSFLSFAAEHERAGGYALTPACGLLAVGCGS